METMAKQSKLVTKKLIKYTRDNEPPSSVDAVVSNDDLLIEILLRLSVSSLYRFKSVSKHWLSIITSSNFNKRWSEILNFNPPSALFLEGPNIILFLNYDFLSFDIQIPVRKSLFCTTFDKAASKFLVMQSCNGLLLCRGLDNFYVFNPSINLFKMLPQRLNLNRDRVPYLRLAFDPSKSRHYKVLHAEYIDDAEQGLSIRIQSYSSEAGYWTVCDDLFPEKSFRNFNDGIYWNGGIHWINDLNELPPSHFELDIVDHPVLTTIKSPQILDGKVNSNCKLFESSGCLLLLFMDDVKSQELHVYEMRNGYCEWSEKYIVNFDEMERPVSETWRISSSVRCVVFGERDDVSFMVIELDEKVFQYKFIQKTLRRLCDLTNFEPTTAVHPFTASFASV